MATFERVTTTFTRGELSRRALARLDFEGRFDGVEKLENFLVHVQGGAQKRTGTRFVAAARDESSLVRLIPFEVNVDQNYIIEASDSFFRFYADEGRLESPPGTPVEVGTPFSNLMLPELRWTQSADVLFLAHPDTTPRMLTRTSATSFALALYDFHDGPYLDTNTTDTTLTLSGTTGTVTVTASAADGINSGQGFLAADVGRLIRWKDPDGDWTWLQIATHVNATEVTANFRGPDASAGTATTSWRLGAWSSTTGWPSVCAFHQGRLWWGRTSSQPQTIWATSVGEDFRVFSPSLFDGSVTDDRAITLTIDSNQVNAIAWFVSSQRGLQVGTTGEEWLLHSADNTSGLTPTSAEVAPQGSWGSDDLIAPVRVGTSSIYVQRGSTVIRESAFNFDEDAYTAQNITVLSEHLFRRGISRLAFAQNPIQTVWALLENGSLAGFTFDKEQKVIAWHHHTIAGSAAGAAEILDIAVVKAGVHDQVWMVVRRTIDGAQHQYVEFFEEPFDVQLHEIEDAFFVDSGLTYSGAATATISGLDHLEGEEVTILADGSVQPSKTVSSGQITLDRAAAEVHVGLDYSSEIVTLPHEASQREGPFVSLGKVKRIHNVSVLFAETVGVKVGPFEGKLDTVTFRTPSVLMGAPVQPFDGIKKLAIEGEWEEMAQVHILSDQPLPCTVLAIVAESQIYGI